MKVVGETVGEFAISGIKPGEDSPNNRKLITHKNFADKWKVILFYPNNFEIVPPLELNNIDNLFEIVTDKNAVILIGSDDQDFSKTAWTLMRKNNDTISAWLFADNTRPDLSLANKLGITKQDTEFSRIIFIIDPTDTVQYVSSVSLDVSHNINNMLTLLQSGNN
jgi:alkyl hydroperoxide reductase subunit AhpC